MSRPATSGAPSTNQSQFLQESQQQQQQQQQAGSGTRNSFIGRHFGRRPKTAHTYSQDSAPSSASTSSAAIATENSQRTRSGDHGARSRLLFPRSSSSSRVHPDSTTQSAESAQPLGRSSLSSNEHRAATSIDSRAARPRPNTGVDPSHSHAFPSLNPVDSTHSASGDMINGGGPQNGGGVGNGGGGSNPFGRMFRRYSQGASRLDAQAQAQSRESAHQPQRAGHLGDQRGRSTPPRSSQQVSPVSNMPQSASHGSLALPSHESTGLANSRTLATLADGPAAGDAPAAAPAGDAARATGDTDAAASTPAEAMPIAPSNTHRIRLVPHLEATRSLHFEPIERDLREGNTPVKVGRFTDRQPAASASATVGGPAGAAVGGVADADSSNYVTVAQPGARGGAITISTGQSGGPGSVRIDSSRVAFKSKVVSRGHAEIWCEAGGKFFIKDTKSSSGTFLNHIRLSAPNIESRPFAIKDGDVIQLGVDYQGGTEEIYRCVKMRVELNRGWQREANQFNVNALRQLRALQGTPIHAANGATSGDGAAGGSKDSEGLPTNRQAVSVTDCCICLFSVTVCQALFIAPCSHVFHYKCIRPLLTLHHPGFSCPLCRTFADLEADVEEDEAWQEALLKEAAAAESRAARGQPALEVSTPRAEVEAPIAEVSALEASSLLALANLGDSTAPAVAATSSEAARLPPRLAGSGMGRGTAVSALRRAEWARPDTAVGSSAGPLSGNDAPADSTFAPEAAEEETAQLSDPAATTGQPSDEDASAGIASVDGLPTDEDPTLSALRRGSAGPIEIGRGVQGRARGSGDFSSDSAYAAATSRLASAATSTPPGSDFPFAAATSPGLDSRTPLDTMFLSTLAEAPVASVHGRDFLEGRVAPADRRMPSSSSNPGINSSSGDGAGIGSAHRSRSDGSGGIASGSGSDGNYSGASPRIDQTQRSSGEAEGSGGRLSEGGDETETAERTAGVRHRGVETTELGEPIQLPSSGRKTNKGRDIAPPLVDRGDSSADTREGDARASRFAPTSKDTPSPKQSHSRSHSRGAKGRTLDADDHDGLPGSPSSNGVRTGPNINASAYMHSSHLRNGGAAGGSSSNGNSHGHGHGERSPSGTQRSPAHAAGPTATAASASASPSSSALSKFKRKFSSGGGLS